MWHFVCQHSVIAVIAISVWTGS